MFRPRASDADPPAGEIAPVSAALLVCMKSCGTTGQAARPVPFSFGIPAVRTRGRAAVRTPPPRPGDGPPPP